MRGAGCEPIDFMAERALRDAERLKREAKQSFKNMDRLLMKLRCQLMPRGLKDAEADSIRANGEQEACA